MVACLRGAGGVPQQSWNRGLIVGRLNLADRGLRTTRAMSTTSTTYPQLAPLHQESIELSKKHLKSVLPGLCMRDLMLLG